MRGSWRSSFGAIAVALALGGCSARKTPTTPPPGTEAQIAEAERLGAMMAVHEAAATSATDQLLRIGALSPPSGILGRITVPEPERLTVRFIGEANGVYSAFYDVSFTAEGMSAVKQLTPPEPLPAAQQAAFTAQRTAIASSTLDCAEHYDAVVFQDPFRAGDDWFVYLLPATTRPGRVMVGRQQRLRVSGDGKRVLESRALSKDCVYVDRPDAAPNRAPTALFATNLVSPTPNESHVFLNLHEGLPLAVGTSLGNWIVERGRIRYLGPQD